MRHYYKPHRKHCYLRVFQSKCPKCNATVLYWECTHGNKVFFEYSSYGNLMSYFCLYDLVLFNKKKNFQIVVKKEPIELLEKQSPNCPVCRKLFKNINSSEKHLENLRKNDIYHTLFFENKIPFEDSYKETIHKDFNQIKYYEQPEFGKFNVKIEKKIN